MKKLIQSGLIAAIGFTAAGASQAAYVGSLETEQGTYEIAARMCAIYDEDGAYDIEIYGPGKTPEGEKLYFEFSSTGQFIDINIGTDSQFSSSDDRIQSSGEFQLIVDEKKVGITKITLVDQKQQLISSDATFQIDCTVR